MASSPSPMRKLPTQERSKQRVEKIIATAQEFMATEGIDSLTCSKVAERAGLPNATLYQFFPNKESIFEVIAERWLFANMQTLTKNDPSDGKFGHWQAWIEASVANDYLTYKSQKALLPLVSVMNASSRLREIEQSHDVVIKSHMVKGIGYFFNHLDDDTLSMLAEITMSVSHTLLLKAAGSEEAQSVGYLSSLKYMLNSLYLKYSY